MLTGLPCPLDNRGGSTVEILILAIFTIARIPLHQRCFDDCAFHIYDKSPLGNNNSFVLFKLYRGLAGKRGYPIINILPSRLPK